MVKINFKRLIIFLMAVMTVSCFGSFFLNFNFDVHATENQNFEINVEVQSLDDYVMGQVEGAGKYALGDTVTLRAIASEGCQFVIWQRKNKDDNYENIIDAIDPVFSFTAQEDVDLRAVFAYTEYSFDCDYLTYFDLVGLTTDYGIAPDSYVRADVNTIFDSGVFYHNDKITLDFEHKTDVYVQRLSLDNFSSDSLRGRVIVNITSSNIVTTINKDGKEVSYESLNMTFDELVASENFSLDLDNYDYYILTQTEAPERYTTTHIKLITKMNADLTFSLRANQLMMFKIEAYDTDDNRLDLSSDTIRDLVKFEYGYYGALDTSSEIFTYLVENGSNYCFNFYSNYYYRYENATIGQISTSNKVTGYFNSYTTQLVVRFTKIKYSITISEYLKNGDNYLLMNSSPYFSFPSISLFPGEKLTLEIDELADSGRIFVDDVLLQELDFLGERKYGYKIFTISTDYKDLNISLSTDVVIDPDTPSEVILYVVYEKLEYNMTFDVIDSSGNISEYFKTKVKYMNSNKMVERDDEIVLNADVLNGYKFNWTKVKDREILLEDYLTDLSFNFIPEDNDVSKEYSYYLMVEYEYYDYTYRLSERSFDNYKMVADLTLAFIKSFELDTTTNTLKVYADLKEINGDGQTSLENLLIFSEVLTVLSENETSVDFSSSFGNIKLKKDGENFVSLTVPNVEFNYDEASSRFVSPSVTNIDDLACTIVITEVEKVVQFSISKVTCDDLILNIASNSENGASYQFAYFTLDKSTQLSNVIVSTSFENIQHAENTNYAWLFNGTKNVELLVVFTPTAQTIRITRNLDVYNLGDINCSLLNATSDDEKIAEEDMALVIYALNGTTISIKIDYSKIEKGYKFKQFTFTTQVAVTPPSTSFETNSASLNFRMEEAFYGANILIEFEVIDYKINIVSNATYAGRTSNLNDITKNELDVTDDGGNFKSSFSLKVTDIEFLPTLEIDSGTGSYISMAYINEEENSLPSLIGNISSQTYGKLIFGTQTLTGQVSFREYVQNLADENYEITLYLTQTSRTYSVIVEYVIKGENNVKSVTSATIQKDSETPCKPADEQKSITFSGIPYNQTISLRVDDSSLVGATFMQWENESFVRISDSAIISRQITQNITLYVRFEVFSYKIEFKKVDSQGNAVDDSVGDVKMYISKDSGVNKLESQTFNICDSVYFDVSSSVGFEFKEFYYLYGANYKGQNGIAKNNNEFSFEGINLNRIDYFNTSRDDQKNDLSLRTLQIYLVYVEKLYEINVSTKNSTTGSEGTRDTTGWLTTSVKYYDSTTKQYVEKEAGEDGFVKYPTNSSIQVVFNQNIKGILFQEAQLENAKHVVSKIGETLIDGQIVSLATTNDGYVLTFNLSTGLLTELKEDGVFNVLLLYYLKSYKVSFYAGVKTSDGGIKLIEKYSLYMEIGLTDYLTTWTNVSGTGTNKNEVSSRSSLYYNTNIRFLTRTDNNDNFKGSYDFISFMVNGKIANFMDENNRQNNEYTLNTMVTLAETQEEINIWELCDNELIVYALYVPKITINTDNFEFKDGKYTKTVTYNGYQQKITTSLDTGVDNPDIVFNTDEFKSCVILYNGSLVLPKNAGDYEVSLTIGGVLVDKKICLKIDKCEVELIYNSSEIIKKQYDGTNHLTSVNRTNITNFLTLRIVGKEVSNTLCANDMINLDFGEMTGYYSSAQAGSNLTIFLNEIKLGDSISWNYCFKDRTSKVNAELIGKGEITPKQAYIEDNLFIFADIVYKAGEPYKLKYKETNLWDALGVFKEGFILTITNKALSNDEVFFNLDKISITLVDYSIGVNKKIVISLNNALAGSSSTNYYIEDIYYYIDIYPYKLEVGLETDKSFVIIDLDELCCIPIDLGLSGKLHASYIDATNPDYPNLFGVIEKLIKNDDRIHAFYEFALYGESGNMFDVNNLRGAYVMVPKVKDLKTVYERTDEGYVGTEYFIQDDYIYYKISEETRGGACLVVDRSYFPIWKIILIISLILLFIGILWFIFFILRKKREKDEDENRANNNI